MTEVVSSANDLSSQEGRKDRAVTYCRRDLTQLAKAFLLLKTIDLHLIDYLAIYRLLFIYCLTIEKCLLGLFSEGLVVVVVVLLTHVYPNCRVSY